MAHKVSVIMSIVNCLELCTVSWPAGIMPCTLCRAWCNVTPRHRLSWCNGVVISLRLITKCGRAPGIEVATWGLPFLVSLIVQHRTYFCPWGIQAGALQKNNGRLTWVIDDWMNRSLMDRWHHCGWRLFVQKDLSQLACGHSQQALMSLSELLMPFPGYVSMHFACKMLVSMFDCEGVFAKLADGHGSNVWHGSNTSLSWACTKQWCSAGLG